MQQRVEVKKTGMPSRLMAWVGGKSKPAKPQVALEYGAIPWLLAVAVATAAPHVIHLPLWLSLLGGSVLLLSMLLGSLALWHRVLGTVSVDSVSSPQAEVFYWVTIMFSQTLGTALGDWTADSAGLGYVGGMVIFTALIALVAAAYRWTAISRTALFWAAFVLTRPLGAVVGDFLDKPLAAGGLDLSHFGASAVLMAFIVGCVLLIPQRAAPVRH